MTADPGRKQWLWKLLDFMEERNRPIEKVYKISKQPLDLYCLYMSVKSMGGYVKVSSLFWCLMNSY